MRGVRTFTALVIVGSALLAGGCASLGEPVDTSECVAVDIRNNYSALHSVEAFILSSGSPPLRLGNVRPGSSRTFLFRPRTIGAPHRLYVRFLGKDWEIASREFAPVPEQILIWDVGANYLRPACGAGGAHTRRSCRRFVS